MTSTKTKDNSDFNDDKSEWTKGVSKVHQIFIVMEYKRGKSCNSDKEVLNTDPAELIHFKQKRKKAAKQVQKR